MFDEKLATRFGRLQGELNRILYRRYTLQRESDKLGEDILRIEASLAELDGLRRDVEAQKAIEEAQAKADAEDAQKERKKK